MSDIDPLFQSPALNVEGAKKTGVVQYVFTKCLQDLEAVIALGGREGAIVRTKLEEAGFYACKVVALTSRFQQAYVPPVLPAPAELEKPASPSPIIPEPPPTAPR